MKYLLAIFVVMLIWSSTRDLQIAEINWVDGYYTSGGQYRSGHWKDTSGDGYEYNNANYMGLND